MATYARKASVGGNGKTQFLHCQSRHHRIMRTGTYCEGGVGVYSASHDVSVGVDFFHCLIVVQIMERIIEALRAEFYRRFA